MCVSAGASGGQKNVSDPLELEFQVAVTWLVWALSIELMSSAKAVLTCDC